MYSAQSDDESYAVFVAVASALSIVGVLWLLSIVFTLIKRFAICVYSQIFAANRLFAPSFSSLPSSNSKLEYTKDFGWLTVCILADGGYALLLLYCHWRALPPVAGRAAIQPRFYEGLVQSFALVVYGPLATFVTNDVLRQALGFRASKLVNGYAPISSPTLPRRALRCSIGGHNPRPLFLQKDSGAKISVGSLRRPLAAA